MYCKGYYISYILINIPYSVRLEADYIRVQILFMKG